LVPGCPAGRSGGDFPGNSSWILSNWILDWIMDTWGWLERMGKQRGSQKISTGLRISRDPRVLGRRWAGNRSGPNEFSSSLQALVRHGIIEVDPVSWTTRPGGIC